MRCLFARRSGVSPIMEEPMLPPAQPPSAGAAPKATLSDEQV